MKRLQLTCLECKAVFLRYPSQIKDTGNAYCSIACVGKSKRHGSTLFCALCDSPFYRRMGEQDIGVAIKQFCSRQSFHARCHFGEMSSEELRRFSLLEIVRNKTGGV